MAENHQIAGEPPVTILVFVCDITDWFIGLCCYGVSVHQHMNITAACHVTSILVL